MKETTNVSIAGIAFRLDNEGYLQLKNYLTRIELGYKNNPDGAEILADIEARVCELILNQQSADQLVPADRIRDIIDAHIGVTGAACRVIGRGIVVFPFVLIHIDTSFPEKCFRLVWKI